MAAIYTCQTGDLLSGALRQSNFIVQCLVKPKKIFHSFPRRKLPIV